ncbi:hypothetical protein O181_011004 [Austropuccinia psidii MF-1]|uniref:Uncharacterized protein n=1 Tax=Austropuccinia psidii MF-1 TaxID=1389203 RepID=A0A9Q3BTP8_9BASI|nr:hypothetical protein [Austropuccinia psidii MF-1]
MFSGRVIGIGSKSSRFAEGGHVGQAEKPALMEIENGKALQPSSIQSAHNSYGASTSGTNPLHEVKPKILKKASSYVERSKAFTSGEISGPQFESIFTKAKNSFKEFAPKLFERFKSVEENKPRYSEVIHAFEMEFTTTASVEEKLSLLTKTFDTVTPEERILRSSEELKMWASTFERLMVVDQERELQDIRLEIKVQFCLLNLIIYGTKTRMTARSSRSLLAIMTVEEKLWRRIEISKLKWTQYVVFDEANWGWERAVAIDQKISKNNYVGEFWTKLKEAARDQKDTQEFVDILLDILKLARRKGLAPAEDKTAATTALLYTHQSIASDVGLKMTKWQKKNVRIVIGSAVTAPDADAKFLFPHYQSLQLETAKRWQGRRLSLMPSVLPHLQGVLSLMYSTVPCLLFHVDSALYSWTSSTANADTPTAEIIRCYNRPRSPAGDELKSHHVCSVDGGGGAWVVSCKSLSGFLPGSFGSSSV